MPTAIPPPAIAVATAVPARPAALDLRHWIERAQGDLRAARVDRGARYAIQVELVCELASLDEAWRYDRGGALWLLTADYRGQRCFRVFWGKYATLEEARAAKSSVPKFFFTPTNQPTVVSTRALLP
jgi:septal ring-binding cell division protein DamX